MKLYTALGTSMVMIGSPAAEIEVTLDRALSLAQSLGDIDYQLRSLHGHWILREKGSLSLAQEFLALASAPVDRDFGHCMVALSSHWLGHQNVALHHLLNVTASDLLANSDRDIGRYQIDRWTMAQSFLGRILWLRGFPSQAIEVVKAAVNDALKVVRANSLCRLLARGACPVALWVGDLTLAERYVDLLFDCANRNELALMKAFANGFRGILLTKRGDFEAGVSMLREGLRDFGGTTVGYRRLNFLGELAEALGQRGEIVEGLAVVDDAIARCTLSEELWGMAELLRIKGELIAMQGGADSASEAEANFRKAIDCAEQQGAPAWGLRAATSLARLLKDEGRSTEAAATLSTPYNRFTEGFDSTDLMSARVLLESLERG